MLISHQSDAENNNNNNNNNNNDNDNNNNNNTWDAEDLSMEFSDSRQAMRSISSVIRIFNTSTSSRTANIKWLLTRSMACSILLSMATVLLPPELPQPNQTETKPKYMKTLAT